MNKLRALEVFVAIVDGGSLTRAAESLSMSLPAVVRQLAALEGSVGARLLNRTTRRLSLTDEGRTYLERVRRILGDLEEADQALVAEQAEPSGNLTITAPVLFGQLHVAPAVRGFLEKHEKTKVNLLLLDRVVNLVEEGIDVGVRIAHLNDSTLVATTVGKVRQVVVASPALLKRLGTPRHPRELAAHDCVRFTHRLGETWTFTEGARRFDVPVRGRFESNLIAPAIEACAAGMGFGSFLSYQVESWVRARKLRVVLADFETPPRAASIVYPSARLLPSRTRTFVAWLRRALERKLSSALAL